jgi:hypothetical protein
MTYKDISSGTMQTDRCRSNRYNSDQGQEKPSPVARRKMTALAAATRDPNRDASARIRRVIRTHPPFLPLFSRGPTLQWHIGQTTQKTLLPALQPYRDAAACPCRCHFRRRTTNPTLARGFVLPLTTFTLFPTNRQPQAAARRISPGHLQRHPQHVQPFVRSALT